VVAVSRSTPLLPLRLLCGHDGDKPPRHARALRGSTTHNAGGRGLFLLRFCDKLAAALRSAAPERWFANSGAPPRSVLHATSFAHILHCLSRNCLADSRLNACRLAVSGTAAWPHSLAAHRRLQRGGHADRRLCHRSERGASTAAACCLAAACAARALYSLWAGRSYLPAMALQLLPLLTAPPLPATILPPPFLDYRVEEVDLGDIGTNS